MYNAQVESTNNQLRDVTEKFNSGVDIGVLAFLINKSRWYLLLFFLLSFSLAFLYLRYSQPIYESRAVIQINDANRADDILHIQDVTDGGNLLAEAIEQIKSRVFLKRVVEKLDIGVNYYAQGTFKSNEMYHSSPYLVKVICKDQAFLGQEFFVELNEKQTAGVIKVGKKKWNFELNNWLRTPYFDVNVYLNDKLSASVIAELLGEDNAYYFVVSDIDAVTSRLQAQVELKLLSELAKTVQIRVKDVNAAKSTDIVNAITEEYMSYDVERKSESSRNILSFIELQLGNVYIALKNTEGDLQQFKKEKNFTDKDILINSEYARNSNLEDEMLRLKVEEDIINEIQKNIQKNKGIDIYELVSLVSGTEYENVIKEVTQSIQKLLNERDNLLYEVTPRSEDVRQVNYKLENQRRLLIESLDAVKLKYKNKYKSLLERTSDFKTRLNKSPEDEVEFSRLNRLYSINEKYYTMLLEKKTEFSISKAGYVSKNIVLEKALGIGVQVSPSRLNALLVALLTSLLFSLGLVFLRYLFHDKIYSLADITRYSSGNVSLLGIIPKYPNDIPVSQLIVDKNPKALISEAFRAVRTNLGFINATPGSKIVSITSTISGEGKTFVAINIAGVLAFTGKKVVLIDLDMRKPKIHKGFGVSNTIGMSTVLTGATPIEACFVNSPLDNLKFVTAGPTPPNPSELILSPRLDEILEYLKKEFDYIVIDNAPVGLVTDGIATIQKADYPIYVFRAGYSKKMFTQILDRLQTESGVKNLSVVLNDVDVSRKIYAYNYGYGYGYGYGTGYYSDDTPNNKK